MALKALDPHADSGFGHDPATSNCDPELAASLGALAPPGALIGHRLITAGDENALLPEEASAFMHRALRIRRASGSARIIARTLLHRLGQGTVAVPKSPQGAPIWPKGVIGSLAHDSTVTVATVSTSDTLAGIGIDVEPAEGLPPDLLDLVTTPRERKAIDRDPFHGRLFFVGKEAVYKAVYPLEPTFLDHHDIEIDLANQVAILRNGRVVNLRFCISSHLVALAFVSR